MIIIIMRAAHKQRGVAHKYPALACIIHKNNHLKTPTFNQHTYMARNHTQLCECVCNRSFPCFATRVRFYRGKCKHTSLSRWTSLYKSINLELVETRRINFKLKAAALAFDLRLLITGRSCINEKSAAWVCKLFSTKVQHALEFMNGAGVCVCGLTPHSGDTAARMFFFHTHCVLSANIETLTAST